jgi:hypothetical protein
MTTRVCLARNGTLLKMEFWSITRLPATRRSYWVKKSRTAAAMPDDWSSVQFQRMPNISLKPGTEKRSVLDMIKGVDKGIYIIGRGSYSIDQQRYNFQFGGQVFTRSKTGKSPECSTMLRTSPTPRNSGIHVHNYATKTITAHSARFSTAKASQPRSAPYRTAVPPAVLTG